MSKPEHDSDFKKALAENGSFDPQKADELRQKTVGNFEAKMRKAERYLWAYMCVLCWLVVFTFFHFMQSSTTKALLFYGILMVVFVESTILMKLWYWIMNNKISVLKAIKQVELGGAEAADTEAFGAGRKMEGPLTGLSRRERAAWWAALIVGCALVGAVKAADMPRAGNRTVTRDGCVTLAANGNGTVVIRESFVNEGIDSVQDTLSYFSPKSHKVRFIDSHGREMPVSVSPQGESVRYDVNPPHPIWPGQRFSYTWISERPQTAKQEGDTWTYSFEYNYGFNTNELSETVVLPEGAEIVSAEPWPVAQFTLGGKPSVRFEAVRGRNEPFRFTVRYRLAGEKR